MTVVSFNVSDFKKEKLNMLDVEKAIDTLGMEVEEITDGVITISITPNRPDLIDFFGLVRAIKYVLGTKKPREMQYLVKTPPVMTVSVGKNVSGLRPFITAFVVNDVDLSGERLKYLINFTEKLCETYGRKRRKLALGLHDLDSVRGNLKYDASTDGVIVPLTESKERTFKDILKEHAKGIAYNYAIENENGLIPFLSDDEKVISLIPIINSDATRVTGSTKNLLVEMTGTDNIIVNQTANMLACSFLDQGAKVSPCLIHYAKSDFITPSLSYIEVKIRDYKITETIGNWVDDNRIIILAEKLGYNGAKYGNSTLFYVPPYRTDIIDEQDIIEDIAIGYGYNKIVPLPVIGNSKGRGYYLTEFINTLALNMVGLGYSEAINNYLTNKTVNFDKVGVKKYDEKEIVSFFYSKTESYTMLRTSLLPGLLANLGVSAHEGMPQRLFEAGGVFAAGKKNFTENINVAFVSEHSKADFAEIKGAFEAILKLFGYDYKLRPLSDPLFVEGRAAEVLIGKDVAGKFGEINPSILKNFSLEEPVSAAELTLFRNVDY